MESLPSYISHGGFYSTPQWWFLSNMQQSPQYLHQQRLLHQLIVKKTKNDEYVWWLSIGYIVFL
jgi:hypothetical protein